MKKIISLIAIFILCIFEVAASVSFSNKTNAEEVTEAEKATFYNDTFIITAYYSPILGQSHYVTGSYESDIRLNGRGTNGADGTEVYPGMIAAPKKYPFGTKMNIPGIGIVAVHDRGGAIVESGVRGHEHDRLDIWMGFGDAGLQRALSWGKRTVDVTVYGLDENVKEQIYLEGYSEAERIIKTTILAPLNFPHDIYYGSDGEEVQKMQQYLVDWAYLSEATGFYGEDTAEAIYQFQLNYDIVAGPDELGAGHFGINTRTKFDALIKNGVSEESLRLQKGKKLLSKYSDLNDSSAEFSRSMGRGDKGEDVSKLQEELQILGFLRIDPTGFYGEVTEHALFKFQQSRGIVAKASDDGAGYFGPTTRDMLNTLIDSRIDTKSLIAYRREEIELGKHLVKIPGFSLVQH